MTAATIEGYTPLEHGPEWVAEYAALRARSGDFPHAGLLGYTETNGLALHAIIEEGMPFSAHERFRAITACTTQEMALLLGVPQGALESRRASGRLKPRESDVLFRAARIVWMALDACAGNLMILRRWLRTEARALGGETPLGVVGTDVGAQLILSWVDHRRISAGGDAVS